MSERLDALAELLDLHGRRLFGLLVRITLREDAADDLLQDLVLKLHAAEGFWRADDRLAYARRAAVHLAFDWRRRTRRADAAPLETLIDGQPALLDALVQRELEDEVIELLSELPRKQRTAIVLRYLESEPFEVVAQQLGTTAHRARALCHKGLATMRARLCAVATDPLPPGGAR